MICKLFLSAKWLQKGDFAPFVLLENSPFIVKFIDKLPIIVRKQALICHNILLEEKK